MVKLSVVKERVLTNLVAFDKTIQLFLQGLDSVFEMILVENVEGEEFENSHQRDETADLTSEEEFKKVTNYLANNEKNCKIEKYLEYFYMNLKKLSIIINYTIRNRSGKFKEIYARLRMFSQEMMMFSAKFAGNHFNYDDDIITTNINETLRVNFCDYNIALISMIDAYYAVYHMQYVNRKIKELTDLDTAFKGLLDKFEISCTLKELRELVNEGAIKGECDSQAVCDTANMLYDNLISLKDDGGYELGTPEGEIIFDIIAGTYGIVDLYDIQNVLVNYTSISLDEPKMDIKDMRVDGDENPDDDEDSDDENPDDEDSDNENPDDEDSGEED